MPKQVELTIEVSAPPALAKRVCNDIIKRGIPELGCGVTDFVHCADLVAASGANDNVVIARLGGDAELG